jgi:hypothetical protein
LFEDFFGGPVSGRYKQKLLRAEGEEIEVLPVPAQDKPKDFSGLVGAFQLEAALTNENVKTGETVTLTVTVRGQGMVDQLEHLKLDLPQQMKVYTDKPISEQVIDENKGFVSSKTFKFALVPTEPGTYDLPPVTLRVFVPKLGSYVELTAALPRLNVTGEKESIGTAVDGGIRQQKVKKLAEDLLGIRRGDALLSSHELQRFDYWVLSAISGLPMFALMIGWLWRRRKDDIDPNAVLQKRRSQAFRQLSLELKAAGVSSALFQGLRTYLGDILGIKGGAVTEKDAVARLQNKGVSADELSRLNALWTKLAKAEYGGAAVSQNEFEALRNEIMELAKEIDHQC